MAKLDRCFLVLILVCCRLGAQGGAKAELFLQLGHTHRVNSVAMTPDGRTVISAANDKSLKFWDATSGREMRTLALSDGASVTNVALAPDGATFTTLNDGGKIQIQSLEGGAVQRERQTFGGLNSFLTYAANGNRLFTMDPSGKGLQLWNPASGEGVMTLMGHTGYIICGAISGDGKVAVSGGMDGTLRLWDVASGANRQVLVTPGQWTQSVAISPDGRRFASIGQDHTLRFWDALSGQVLQALPNQFLSGAFLFSPDGRLLAGCQSDGVIRLWDAEAAQAVRTLKGSTYGVSALSFSADGSTLVAGYGNGTIKLWDVASGLDRMTLGGRARTLKAIAFSPDGRTVASVQEGTTIVLTNLATGGAGAHPEDQAQGDPEPGLLSGFPQDRFRQL
jgi:WD40 repeat protein